MWTGPPSVEGRVKSGALSPTLSVEDGGATVVCAERQMAKPEPITSRLVISMFYAPKTDSSMDRGLAATDKLIHICPQRPTTSG